MCLLVGAAFESLVSLFVQVSSQWKEESALSLQAWPVPASSGLSPSPACLCATGDERQAAGTSSAASPRCAACTASPHRGTCPVWTKANWKRLFATPAACSLCGSQPLCTRRIRSHGAGTRTLPYRSVPLHCHRRWGHCSPPVAVDPSHRHLQVSLLPTSSSRTRGSQTVWLRPAQTLAGLASVRGS